ncbi:unnamed protein product [Sphagnum troendelagicum]|uniref:Protein kinase domain-containing protein n=1 Tax=Sphagnum troendelagicum TaxID=128251 RepID=A0ABP0UAD2_9BRYO
MLNFEVMDKCLGFSTASLLITILGVLCNLTVLAAISQNPQVPGSLFINCGSDFSYVDNATQILWVPDDQYITTGVKAFVPLGLAWYPQYSELQTLRYFPPSAHLKDCYKLPVIPNNTYQIRATFFYGDYDNGSETLLPNFELAIDATIVGSNLVSDFAQFQYAEYWVLTQTNVMSLCLSRIPSSNTNPFITAISLVPIYPNINSTAYECLYGGLYYHTHFRWNFGASGLLRYPDDPRDSYWYPQPWNSTVVIATTMPPMQTLTGADGLNPRFDPPAAVLDTALTTNGTMTITFPFINSYVWDMSLYCVELDPTANATSREFYTSVLGYSPDLLINPFAANPNHTALVEYIGGAPFSLTLFQNSSTSTRNGPLVNAMEIYEIMTENVNLLTNEQDALAIEGIKTSYPQLAEWTGDPCLPYPHSWVTCNTINASVNNPFIIAVALDNNSLSGSLPDFSNFVHLMNLNLSHNQLNGSIPPSIWGIFNLSVLDLSQNKLSGNLIPTYMETPCPTSLTKLNLGSNNLDGSFPMNLLNCANATWQEINLDHNYFNGTLNMVVWDQNYLLHGVFISMVNNNISGLEPSWDDKSLIYSPVLLGGNPICNNIQISSNPQISYHQQLNCRYNNSLLNVLVTKSHTTKDILLIWILSTTLSLSLIIGGIICVVIFLKYKKNTLTLREFQKEFAKQQVQPTLYSYSVLKLATKDFHQNNELGKGGFGVVYKGCLVDGTIVAVKLLTTKSHQGTDDFLNEVVSITGITHKNLVKLKGCCLHRTQRLLVYEFLENKDLAEALWGCGIKGISFLDWPTRYKICVGIARGLTYLHEDLQPCIIHRDIKASNILLDNNLNAKITDFGLARLFSQDQSHLFTDVRVGTFGYMSPEYAGYGELSTKVDVYSFGVLMLEIISGRKSIVNFTSTSPEQISLVKWAWILQKNKLLNDLIDQKMINTLVANEVQLVINVALLCVQKKATKRPVMSHALAMLEGKMDIPSSLFTHESDIQQDTTTSTSEDNHLLTFIMSNNIELTNLDPR